MAYPSDAERFAELAAELTAKVSETLTTDLVVSRALEFAPEADHASLTVKDRRSYKTLGATSALAAELDAAQYRLKQGPCIESADHGEWCRSGDIGHDPRWPGWGPLAAERGIGSMLSIRLLVEDKPFGALNLYSERAAAFANRDSVEIALVYAIHAANALATAQLVANLETALSTRNDIGVAQGILMASYGLSAETAFRAMCRISMDTNVKLRHIALDVIRTRRLPTTEDSRPD